MSEQLKSKILSHLKSEDYRPQRPRGVARELNLHEDETYGSFRTALRDLMREGRAVIGARGAVMVPAQKTSSNEFIGTYRHNRRGFGFVVPTDPGTHEDLYIPQGENAGALTGDTVRAKITSRGQRDGRAIYTGRITQILKRGNNRFVGTLLKHQGQWAVAPDGNTMTDLIDTPDAASRNVKAGTKVVVELTEYPEEGQRPQGVITEVLGVAGEKDVDLKSVIVQFDLPGEFPEEVRAQARTSLDSFDPDMEMKRRLDLSGEVICTIDPDDAKDYDDAISLRQVESDYWELGVHIADVSHFVKTDTPLDIEARARGNSSYFPGYVIPMLPEVLSNGVCSLQEAVPRLCKSVFITYDEDARPIRTRFANTIIKSRKRLRYREAQAILDMRSQLDDAYAIVDKPTIPHPDGPKRISDYPDEVIELLRQMDDLAKRLKARRSAQGQLSLDLPQVELVLDEEGKVIDAVPEDTSFTHTLIEMFMVEANEAVARLLDSLHVPFLRRVHPEPELQDADRLRQFIQVAGHKVPKNLDRKALQHLLSSVKGRPEAFAINLAVLKSLTRAEYSPQEVGHYALASEQYCHFTSPIRRYADLTIHRLLDAYFDATDGWSTSGKAARKRKIQLDGVPSYDDLVQLGRHISYTERRSEDAERELRQVKILTLLETHIGDEFAGVVTGIANFGLFVQIQQYLIDGLIRYEDLMDDWWDVDERSGLVRGQRTGTTIRIGDPVRVRIVRIDLARRELDLAIVQLARRGGGAAAGGESKQAQKQSKKKPHRKGRPVRHRGSKQR